MLVGPRYSRLSFLAVFALSSVRSPLPRSRLLAGRTGELWVSDSQPEDFYSAVRSMSPKPSVWRVFGTKGERVGKVSLPPRFLPYDAGVDSVLGIRWDDDDVEHVTMLRLLR